MSSEGINAWISNQYLFNLSESLSELGTRSINTIIEKILFHAINDLENCECVHLCYGWDETDGTFSAIFTHDGKNFQEFSRTDPSFEKDLLFAADAVIADSAIQHRNRFIIDKQTNKTKNYLLCSVPMENFSKKVIGVLQFRYSEGQASSLGPINYESLKIFMTYSAILLFEKIYGARCEVMADKLKYHTLPSPSDIQKIKIVDLPNLQETNSIYDFKFDDAILNDDTTVKIVLEMFKEFKYAEHLKVSEDILLGFIMTVKKSYRALPYHNWRHGLNVTQTMFAILKNTEWSKEFLPLENLGSLIACLCHDVDHRGTSNKFQIKMENSLAQLYCTSTMEEHHLEQCITIINDTRILGLLSPEEYKVILKTIKRAIIATDLVNYLKNKKQFKDLIDSKTHDWTNSEHRYLTHDMLMTVCDLNATVKPFEIQKRVAYEMAEEFYQEGDLLKEAFPDVPIELMMNRGGKEFLPKIQIGFIDNVCWTVYECFEKLSKDLSPLAKQLETNREEWNKEWKKVQENRGYA